MHLFTQLLLFHINFLINNSNFASEIINNVLKQNYYDNKGKSAFLLQNVIRKVRFEEG